MIKKIILCQNLTFLETSSVSEVATNKWMKLFVHKLYARELTKKKDCVFYFKYMMFSSMFLKNIQIL